MILVLGLGNDLSRMDSLGTEIVKELENRSTKDVVYLSCGSAPENFVSKCLDQRVEKLIVVDVGEFGGRAGDVKIFTEIIEAGVQSTHKPKLSHLVKLLDPEEVYFVLIQRGSLLSQVKEKVFRVLDDLVHQSPTY